MSSTPGGTRHLAARAVRPALGARMMGNLLENAARYGEGSPVTVRARQRPGEVELEVADQGPGVAEPALTRLFEPFFRADASRSRRTGGSGLMVTLVLPPREGGDQG